MSNTRARHRSKTPWPKRCVHYVHNFPGSILPCLQRAMYTLHFVHNHAFSALIYMLHCNALEIALCTEYTCFNCTSCFPHSTLPSLHCHARSCFKYKTHNCPSALLALLVAVSLIFTPTRLLRCPRATKPLPGDEDDGNFFLVHHIYIYIYI